MLTRRTLVLGAPSLLAGCVTQNGMGPMVGDDHNLHHLEIYGAVMGEPFPVPAVDLSGIDPKFYRREVAYSTREALGTIVVDPGQRFAYLVQEGGRAIRYGVGVGREEAFNFRGVAIVARKAEWPRWVPTQSMIKREPNRYRPYAAGMAGGVNNPLGPRALYLYANGQDTYYRLHGTVEPWTIGTMVSSGCVRLINQDIIDLYRRVAVGTRVVVLPAQGGDVA